LAPAARAGDKEHDKEPKDEDRPTEKMGLKSRVFEVKHRTPEELIKVLRPLTSGIKGTSMVDGGEFRTITVRDFPENLAAIDEALRRLDVPRAQKPDVELRIRVLIAAPNGASQYPGELDPVVKQLHATLSYKSYYQIASITHRVKSGSGAKGKGITVVNPPVSSESGTMNYSYGFEDVVVAPPGAASNVVQIRKLSYWTGGKALGEAEINTALSLREGEKVVVGTASLKDRAMILVLFAHIVK
jgi:type II secretory pathway component GspD/PulD (secretin)